MLDRKVPSTIISPVISLLSAKTSDVRAVTCIAKSSKFSRKIFPKSVGMLNIWPHAS